MYGEGIMAITVVLLPKATDSSSGLERPTQSSAILSLDFSYINIESACM